MTVKAKNRWSTQAPMRAVTPPNGNVLLTFIKNRAITERTRVEEKK